MIKILIMQTINTINLRARFLELKREVVVPNVSRQIKLDSFLLEFSRLLGIPLFNVRFSFICNGKNLEATKCLDDYSYMIDNMESPILLDIKLIRLGAWSRYRSLVKIMNFFLSLIGTSMFIVIGSFVVICIIPICMFIYRYFL